MAKLAGFRLPQQFMVGFIAGVFSSVLVWIVGLIEPLANSIIAAIRSSRAGMITGTDLGTKLLEMLTGRFSFQLPDLLMAGIGGGILVVLGTWIYNMNWSPDAIPGMQATPMTKLTLVLFYASIVATLILTTFALPTVYTLLVLAVNSIVTAWFVVHVLDNLVKVA